MKVALIKAGVVVNVSELGAEAWTPPNDVTVVNLPVGSLVARGWLYDGVNFTPADPAEDQRDAILNYKVKLELVERGGQPFVDAVTAALTALADPKKTKALTRWNNAAPIYIGDPISDAIKATLGLTNNQLLNFFNSASKKE